MMAGGAVSWLSKKEATISLSTAEAEYIAWPLKTQFGLDVYFGDIGFKLNQPPVLMQDNQGALAMNHAAYSRTKHVIFKNKAC